MRRFRIVAAFRISSVLQGQHPASILKEELTDNQRPGESPRTGEGCGRTIGVWNSVTWIQRIHNMAYTCIWSPAKSL